MKPEDAPAANQHTFPPHLLVLKQIGRGGTAVVYEARHTRLQARVAIKVLHVDPRVADEGKQRLLREAELCANLRDPRLPRVHDVDALPDGTPYVVMELIQGETLDATLRRGPLCYEDAVWLLSELLDVLSVLHAGDIVHRDIKPENLMIQLDSRGIRRLRLIDFGVAKVQVERGAGPRMTRTGVLLGTPHYIAPEVLVGQDADLRVDLYAAAVTFYELLAGTIPFNVKSFGESVAASLRDRPTPLSEHCEQVSPELEAFIQKGLARDPHKRFQSAAEMQAALRMLPEHPGLAEGTATPAAPTPLLSLPTDPGATESGDSVRAQDSHFVARSPVFGKSVARPLLLGLAGVAAGAALYLQFGPAGNDLTVQGQPVASEATEPQDMAAAVMGSAAPERPLSEKATRGASNADETDSTGSSDAEREPEVTALQAGAPDREADEVTVSASRRRKDRSIRSADERLSEAVRPTEPTADKTRDPAHETEGSKYASSRPPQGEVGRDISDYVKKLEDMLHEEPEIRVPTPVHARKRRPHRSRHQPEALPTNPYGH